MSDTIIKITGGVIRQQKNTILKDVNIEIKSGEFIYLIGKVGSGKSSLLKTLYAELPLEFGTAEVAGFQLKRIKKSQIPLLRRKCGIVFQDFKLLTDRDVYSNLDFVLRATGWINKKAIRERIETVLEKVDMIEKKHKMPHQLSGGEQQRIVLARALLNAPPIILADEPTGNIDPETSYHLIELLKEICETGKTIIIATHQYDLIEKYPGRVLCCNNGQLYEKCSTETTNTIITETSTEYINLPEIVEETIPEETSTHITDENLNNGEVNVTEEEITVKEEIYTEDENQIQEIHVEENITIEATETEEAAGFIGEFPFEEEITVTEEIIIEEEENISVKENTEEEEEEEEEEENREPGNPEAKEEGMVSLLGDLTFPEVDSFDYEKENTPAITATEEEVNTAPIAPATEETNTVAPKKATAKTTKTKTPKETPLKSGKETKETKKTAKQPLVTEEQDTGTKKTSPKKAKKPEDNTPQPPAFDLELD